MPTAASKTDRRNNRGAPVFKVSSKAVRREGRHGRGKVHNGAVGDPPAHPPNLTQRQGNPEHAAYPAQMLRLGRTHEFARPSVSTRSRIADGHRQTQTTPAPATQAGSVRRCRRTPTRMIRPRPPATQRDHVVPINNVPPPPRRAPQQTPSRPRARSRRSARCTPRCTSALS
jgi:hypothetical protein